MSPAATAELARALAANHRCSEALARLETIKALNPPLQRAAPIAARCYGQLGRWAEAIAVLRPGAERDSTGNTLAMLGYMEGRAGQREAALATQERLLEHRRAVDDGAMNLAYVPAALGDRDQAFAWIDTAYREGSLLFAPGLRVDLTDVPFDALLGDPRMERLRVRLGLQKR
jgi:tetratricopeptide (TPR) repeat protein